MTHGDRDVRMDLARTMTDVRSLDCKSWISWTKPTWYLLPFAVHSWNPKHWTAFDAIPLAQEGQERIPRELSQFDVSVTLSG
jgi:hypothetical protein